MLEKLKEIVRDRDVSLGVIMIGAGILVWFGLAKFAGLGLMVYGLVQMGWIKGEIVQSIEEHHHHHHHSKPRKKSTPRKKNG